MTAIAAALAQARGRLPTNEARLLLADLLQCTPVWLLTHDDESLDAAQAQAFADLVERRAAGEPIAYLLGQREFYGRRFRTTPATLIPRPETELLVDIALAKVGADGTDSILDLGTGSGCIAISVALERPHATVTALDVSPAALTVAQDNANRLGATVHFLHSDWFDSLDARGFDLILANPPYIAAADPHLQQGDLRFEPPDALASGADGLDAIRRIVCDAPRYLAPHGELWIEHGYDQAAAVRRLLCETGFDRVVSQRDLAGIERISGGAVHS